jgi:NAD(P)-dependent dehydrogenase (short-subunit alcohol dehydrogenase family)
MNANSAHARVAIVTGGSSGIGAATAILLAERGMDVGVTYRTNESGARDTATVIEATGRRAAVAHLDLGAPGDAEGAIGALAAELGRVDALVNNAATNPRATTLEETVESWDHTLAVNLVGPWACARAAAARMISAGRGGRIVNISSVLAFAPLEAGGAYCAAKAGLEALTKVMALEWASHGITVNTVAPGHTATPMNYAQSELDGTVIERPVIPVGRAAEPDEVAGAIAYLVSAEASYATGASLLVDGGLLLHSGPQALQQATGLPPTSA